MKYDIIMGLEVHVELSTKTKIFCGCTTEFGGKPNSHVCPVCLGLPGSLPVLNQEVVEKAIRAGLALNCNIQRENRFDRKNYFYPDLTKNYQISQLYHPICLDGYLDIDAGGASRRITLHEIHMEEDAGKLVHDSGKTLVDYNRCGVPLIEIVTNPDFHTAEEVTTFLEKLQEMLVYLDVSDCKMQEGSMRADVNLSVKPTGSDKLGTRTEMKNINSFKAIQRAIEYEAKRQIALIDGGGTVTQETRRWDDEKGQTLSMRSKENAQDYRYFPDPDLLPISIDEKWISRVEAGLPELPKEKRARYVSQLGLTEEMAGTLTAAKQVAQLYEDTIKEIPGNERLVATLISSEILRLMKETDTLPENLKVSAVKLAAVIKLIAEEKINRNVGKSVIEELYRNDIDPLKYVEEKGLLTVEDMDLINQVVDKVLTDNPQSIEDYKNGKEKAFGFLVGQSMRQLSGKASPKTINTLLKEKLGLEASGGRVGSGSAGQEIGAGGTGTQGVIGADGKERTVTWDIQMEEGNASGEGYRTITCDQLTIDDVGKTVRLAGWVDTIRNHGGIVFVDLRDHYGVTQVVVTEEQMVKINKEMVISVKGEVLKRDADTVNPKIKTGHVEVRVSSISVLGRSVANLPFEIDQSRKTREDLRLKYRFLDLRNRDLHNNIILRSKIIGFLRRQMEEQGFLEIQTPILANSSPEGARDYLVPSRKHKGMFYALPQAPQQFKQMLMASGFDKYFQMAPCFRDEDARMDRSPGEFYQLDFEMSFATQEDVFAVAEQVLYNTFKAFTDKPVTKPPFVRIPYEEAMLKYGSDKPDLRNPLIIVDLSDFFAGVDFKPFQGKTVRAIRVPGCAKMSKSFFEKMEKFAFSIGMKGLGYITVNEDMTYKGPIDKFFTEEQKKEVARLAGLAPDDTLYFISDEKDLAPKYAGQIRTEVAKRMNLIDEDRFDFCYITDFPMFEYNEDLGKIDFTHNPFSMPQGEMKALLEEDPLNIKAYQYDIVCNGVELSSGAVRNHRPEVMVKAFEIAGYSEEDVKSKFSALYHAFQYGAPPHAGMAPGVDRIVMLLAGEENIREVIAFPLASNGQDLLFGSPGPVEEIQLREVHIKIRD